MRRYLLPLLVFCVVVIALFASDIWSLPAGPVPPLGATLGRPTPAKSAERVGDGPVKVLFVDESVVWDWNNTCEDELVVFVTGRKFPVAHLLITLTDDADLPLGVAWPNAENPASLVFGHCAEEGDILACRVSVDAGDPGPALNTALAALLGYSVQEHFRVKSEEGWGRRTAWAWADYRPLVRESEDGWVSGCVEVEK